MKIVINNFRKIFAIQDEFSKTFPGLKIGFYAKSNKSGGAPSDKLVMHSGKTLQDCRVISRKGTIDIIPSMNIKELKESFRNTFGLSAEIFQKPGNGSFDNPLNGGLTLEESNKQAKV
ncbi:MAG: hypothetical protein WCK34_05530 [Bacteroidota bacterium]